MEAITYKGKNSDEAAARRSSCLFVCLRDYILAGRCSPIRDCSPELVRDGDAVLRREVVRRRTSCDSMRSSGQHSLAGGRRIPKSPTPLRGALIGGRRQFLLGFVSPEQARGRNPYLRRALVRRRTGCESALSSGQHSLAGGRRIPKNPIPLRGALTGGRHQLLLGFASPELVQAQNAHLRRAFVRRRIGSESARSSGQHSLAGGGRLPAPHFRRKDPSSEVARGMKKPTTMECGYYS